MSHIGRSLKCLQSCRLPDNLSVSNDIRGIPLPSAPSAYAADPVFEPTSPQISYLLQRIHNRELALPDFQRDYVWDSKATAELLRSIMSRFPVGSLLFWKQGSETQGFASRHFEGAPELKEYSPDVLVLDGQQRLTRLYLAITGASDVKYYVRLNEFLNDDGSVKYVAKVDFETAIEFYDISAKLPFDPTQLENQLEQCLFPVAEAEQPDQWLLNYARKHGSATCSEQELLNRMWAVRDTYLVPLRSYGFPAITLPATTPLEAVCNIFETLNRTGKPLGAFDLVTARLFPQGVRLRDLWHEAQQNYSIIDKDDFDIEPYPVLQAVCLRSRSSAQRDAVLSKLTASDIDEHWGDVVAGFAGVLNFLRINHGVATKRWLPYSMALVPMAAVWPEIKVLKVLDRTAAEGRLAQFFWCSTFMASYDQGANSRAGADYLKLKEWVTTGDGTPPLAVEKFSLAESALRDAPVRRKALHAGVMALTIRAGAKDFYSGETMNAARIKERRIDSHHLFPKAYLNDLNKSELLLNRALIDSETNRSILKKPPSEYLAVMATVHDDDKINDVLESHAVDPSPGGAFRNDDYYAFIDERLEAIVELIENATKLPVQRDLADVPSSGQAVT